MPNWCETNIYISFARNADKGKASKQLKELVEKVEKAKNSEDDNYNGCFLGALYPIPESLRISSGTATDYGMAVIMSIKYNDHTEIDKILSYNYWQQKNITREELIECLITGEHPSANLIDGQKAIDNIKNYGCKDWYEWCVKNWGTKWDLSEMEFEASDEGVRIYSQTAWCPPLAGITKISEEYNLLHFSVDYSEEGMGFKGYAEIENGNCEDKCIER